MLRSRAENKRVGPTSAPPQSREGHVIGVEVPDNVKGEELKCPVLLWTQRIDRSDHMSIIRPFELDDVIHFNNVNADVWTATVCPQGLLDTYPDVKQYHTGYYCFYLAQWPDFCIATQGAFDPSIKAYSKQTPFPVLPSC